MANFRIRITSRTYIKRTLNRISNMLLNGEVDPKVANAIILACNTMLAVIKQDEGINDCENGGNSTMKNSRQYKIQSLLRMAEITDDEVKEKNGLVKRSALYSRTLKKKL